MTHPARPRTDAGAGLIGTIGGVTIVLMFLLFAVQLLVGLYANTTVTAVATDVAARAASANAPRDDAALRTYAEDAERSLGGVDGVVSFEESEDRDGDGALDVIVVRVTATAPRFIPPLFDGDLGVRSIEKVIRIEVEDFVDDGR